MALPGTLFVQPEVIPGYTMIKILEDTHFYTRCVLVGMDNNTYHCYNFKCALVQKSGHWDELIDQINKIKSLAHPNIVRIIDFLYDEKRMYVITEFFNNNNLESLIAVMVPNEHQCHQIISGVMNGLVALHENNIFHGDLTPANVMLYNKCHPKLCNFAFLSNYYPKTEKHFSNYSLNFISPERIQRNYQYMLPSDIWSLGVIVYILYVKDIPFTQCNEIKLVTQMLACRYNPPMINNDVIKRIISQCLVADPTQRAMIQDLKDYYFANVSVHLLAHGRGVRASSSQILPMFRQLKAIEDLAKDGKVQFRRNTISDQASILNSTQPVRPKILRPVKSFVGYFPKN